MAELPIYPERRESPGHALEQRRLKLVEGNDAQLAGTIEALRRQCAVETLKLTGDEASAADGPSVEAQLDALAFVATASAKRAEPTLEDIREMHRLSSVEDGGGVFRTIEVPAQFENARRSPPQFIEDKLENLRAWLGSETGRQMFVAERMALWFARFVEVAPFAHGNFRTAHLGLTFLATHAGYPPVYLERRDADAVRGEVERAIIFDTAPLVTRFSDALSRSLDACERETTP